MLEIISQHVQSHLGANSFQVFLLEVRRCHPGLGGAEKVLDRFVPPAHHLEVFVEAPRDGLRNMLVFLAGGFGAPDPRGSRSLMAQAADAGRTLSGSAQGSPLAPI